jgi:hypothetical protein
MPTNKCLVWCVNSQENMYAVAYQPESETYLELLVQLEEPLDDRLAHMPYPRRVVIEFDRPFKNIDQGELRVAAIEVFDREHMTYVSRGRCRASIEA